LVTEMLALVRIALRLRRQPASPAWLAYGLDRLDRAHRDQVYPDGAYKELSSHYQRIVTGNYQQLVDCLREAGRDELATTWEPRVGRLWAYLRDITTPGGLNPLNNDSDREPFGRILHKRAPRLARGAPKQAVHFPWAGQTVFRDAANHQWAFFDAGPRGTEHAHDDHLAFTCSLGAREFLVDNGRHTYAPGAWRDYFAGPAAHNLVLLDGRAAGQGPREVFAAPRRPRFRRGAGRAVAWGDAVFALDGNPRAADWRRVVLHLDGPGWLVADRVVTFGARTLSTQWHWHPGCVVPTAPGREDGVVIRQADAALRARLVTTAPGGVSEVVAGRVSPAPQGWFSERFNHREPAPALVHAQRIQGPVTNVWLFQPVDAPELRVTIRPACSLEVRVEGAAGFVIDVENPGGDPAPEDCRAPGDRA
jgi:hypothetical protein